MANVLIWTPYATVFLGIWLLTGAASFGIKTDAFLISDLVSGLLLITLGLLSRSQNKWWMPWAISLVGVWLQLAPLLFWADSASYINDTLIGVLAISFSIIVPPLPGQLPDDGPSVPPGWSYNPSSWGQRLPIALFATCGWFLSRYLAAYQLGHIDSVWDPVFGSGTQQVLTSSVSKAFPVSDAGLGAAAYALEMLLTCQGGERRWRTSPWMVTIFGILVVPLGLVTIILIILQPLVVGAWCFLCLITALFNLLPIALAFDEVVVVIQYLRRSKEKPFWELFWKGGTCPQATIDRRSPSSSSSLSALFRSSLWGVTLPWNLVLSVFLGIALMFLTRVFGIDSPIQDLDDVLGPLIVVVSAVSFSEMARGARWTHLLLAVGVFLGAMLYRESLSLSCLVGHILIAALVGLFAFRRGPIKEQWTFRSR